MEGVLITVLRTEENGFVNLLAGYVNRLGLMDYVAQEDVPAGQADIRGFGAKLGSALPHDLEVYAVLYNGSVPEMTREERELLEDGIDGILEQY